MTTAELLVRGLRRLFYGLFIEKHWQVASAPLSTGPGSVLGQLPSPSDWVLVDCPSGYRFIVDPFPHPEGGLLVEGLGEWNQRGDILHLKGGPVAVLCGGHAHFSYPITVAAEESDFLIPEVADWSAPRLYRLRSDDASFEGFLNIPGSPRLLDVTPFADRDGTIYLFANHVAEEDEILRLWVGDSLRGRFAEHPASPILNSRRGSRMAGHLIQKEERLYRLGQDSSRAYGDGIVIYEILELSPESYREKEVGSIRFDHVRGPHTMNIVNGIAFFDFYRDQPSPFVALRRIRSRFSKWKTRARASAV